MKYVLLFVETEEFARDLEAMGPAERDRAYQRVVEWMATHAGHIRGGNKLQSPETATTVRLGGGEPVITDGPFVEGKEHVGGFWVIKAPDLDSALEWGRKATRACTVPIEVRPFQDEAPDEAQEIGPEVGPEVGRA